MKRTCIFGSNNSQNQTKFDNLPKSVAATKNKSEIFPPYSTKTKIDLGIVAEDTNCLPSSHEPEEKQKFHYLFCLDHNTFRFTRGKLLLFHIKQKYEKKLFAYSCGMYFQIRKECLAFIHGTIFFNFSPLRT